MADKTPLPELASAIKATEEKYADLPKGLLEKLAGIESAGGRNLVNPKSSARGPFQFMKDVGPEFGLLTEQDRMDFNKSTDAAARLLLRNKADLEKQIGRPATQGELYLAHQQGARGAANLLKNADKLAADVVGDPERIRLNGGDPATMTAGAFATKWTSKIDGGGGTAPGKKPQSSSLGRMPGVSNERDFYVYDPRELENIDTGALSELPKVDKTLTDVPTQRISALADLARGKPAEASIAEPSEQARPDRKTSAILQGLSTYHKTAERLAQPLADIVPVDSTITGPSGTGGEFSRGVEAGLQNINADQQYFGAIIDTLTGNEAGAKSRIANAQQFEADSAAALAGMQSFEEFLKAPSFEGFIQQVVSSTGQVAPSALDSIASGLLTGGMYSLAKAGLSAGSKVVAKTLVKDLIAKQAKGKALDATEKGIVEGLYKNFKAGAVAGAFGSEYRMMSGEAFAEFGEGGADMDAENAFKSLMIGVPQAALGGGGEYAILKSLGALAGKKAMRSAETSILKKFVADVARTGAKSGLIEGSTEVGQEGISVMQRAAIDPEFTLEDAQMRIGQAAFAGFFGGGAFGGGAAIPAAGVAAARGAKIVDNAKKLLKTVSESRIETEVQNETTGVDDEALAGKATPESSADIEAQMFSVLDPKNPKKAAFIDPESAQQMDVEPGKVKKFDIDETDQSVYVGHIPNKGVIASADPNIVTEVMTVYEAGGDVDAAIGEALGMVGGKEGDNVVRVKNADGAVVHEQVADDESLVAAREQASKIADATPGAVIDEPTVQEAMEERNQKASLDKKEFNAEASALLAMREMLEAEDDKAMDEKAKEPTAPEIKSKSMVVGDEPAEGVADDEADTAADTSDIEDQLNAQYAEIDAKTAVNIEQFPERTTNRDPEVEKKNQKTIDQLWLTLSYVVPEEQYENYKKFKDRMPIKMLEKLIKLNEENNDDGNTAYYDVAEDAQAGQTTKLSITQRDPFPNAETTVTRDAVRDVIKQVAKMRDPKATLRKTEGKARAPSMFWLVNRNTGVAYRLNGTPKTKKKKGRSGVALLAQAGTVLNARTQQALGGKGLTKAQSASQGLMTMLKALAEAGYDFKVGKFPTGLVPFDPQKLPAEAANEPVMTIAGIEGTITDLLYVKAPFEASKSDFDASINREQVVEDQGPDQFAAAEDKKKKLNGTEDELAQSAERDKEQRDEVASKVATAVETAKETKRSAAKIIEEELEPLPSDVTVVIKKVANGWQATVSSPRMERKTVTAKNKAWVQARAHALANAQPENTPLQYNVLALETVDATEKAREAHPEILGVPAEKNQTSVRDEPGTKTSSGTNKVTVLGNIGKLTGKVLSEATKMFNLHRPLTVTTLAHLKENFDALTGEGGKFARAKDTLADIIDKMEDPALDNPAHVLMGGQYLIILRDEPNGRLDLDGNDILAPDDAKIGATLAHEIGHIVFEQEFARVVQGTPLAQAMWEAYTKHVKAMTAERGAKPVQYTNDKEGFEEWYADQVMAYVYNEANQAKGITQSYFKRIAKALREFFHRVNDALGGRLKLSRENISTIRREVKDKNDKTVIKEGGTFADYMDQVVKRNATERAANNTFPVAEQMKVRAMILNLQGRIPANAVRRMQTAAAGIMRTGTWGKLGHGLMNILQASTDFMAANEHGVAGKNLSKFFGTLSQSMDKLGWNKRELFAQNKWNNELANIFGFDDKTNPKEWESAATRAIMVEAMNEDLTDAQLSTPEAKAIRELYKKIETQYLKKPGGQRAGYYIPDFTPRANYGGPRMWNIDKIAKNEQAFVTWLADQLPQNGNPAQRAKDIFDEMTQRTKNQVELIERQVDADLQATGRTNATPATRAAWEFEASMKDRAVMEMRDKVLRNIRRGAYAAQDVIQSIFTMYPSDPDTIRLMATPADQQVDALKKYWMKRTEKIRLTPGMDPALNRKLAPDVKTIDAYNADPNDPNGWLLPPALAHAQYMHYIARRVEYEKMGIEAGARSGSEYVMSQLHAVPEEYRMQVDAAIMANLGKFGENMSNGWRAVNSIAAVWTVFTTLLFTTLSSVTDLAGVATRSKDFNNLGTFFHGIRATLSSREYQELARSVGVVTGRTQEHMMIGQGELDYANKSARSIMNGFFRYTGLEWYTKFTRSFAVGMGREFIINTANSPQFDVREARYLAELGLTRAEVQAWQAGNQDFTTPVGEKVRMAIARFADEAIIRPDASQRPTWASNPYLQTVWQLKSYYYGFGKTVLGGLGREIKNRHTEDGNFNGAAQTMMLYAVTIIPLTMMGMASRDWIKWLFQLALPGVEETASASMKLDTTGYMWEIFKRSGTLGPFALGLNTMEAFKFEGIAAPFTANVPMFDLFDDTIFDGDLTRPLPVINNVK